jgi:hypothetical protein
MGSMIASTTAVGAGSGPAMGFRVVVSGAAVGSAVASVDTGVAVGSPPPVRL